MKEITRIITVQITDIAKVEDNFDFKKSKERTRKNVADAIKEDYEVDDVVVLDVQDFIRDIEPKE